MLKKITIKNFGCIQDLTLDCGFDQKQAPRGYQKADLMPFIQSGAGKETRVCAVQGLFGPNAVGKTTILEALDCLKKAFYGVTFDRKYHPNRLKKGWDQKPVEMAVEVLNGGDCCRYQIAWDASSIVGESLRVNDREVFSVQNGVIQSLAGIPKRKQLRCSEDYVRWWRDEDGGAKRTLLSMLSGNKLGAKLGKAWKSIAYGWQVAQRDRSVAVSLRGLSCTFDGPTDVVWLQKALAELPVFLHRLDSDIVEVKVIEQEPENV